MEERQDLISRQAAIDEVREAYENDEMFDGYEYRLGELPSFSRDQENDRPAEPCEDAVSRADVVDMLEMYPFTEYGEYETAREVVKRLPSVTPKEQQWIPVSERLPEPRVDVWVNSDIGQIQGYYEEHIGVWYASFGQGRDYLELIVNAWMPLPEPYREEEQE